MSLSETELIYLMAYVDGQVDDDELPEVTALLEKSEEARQIVAQHAAMGDWVRTSTDKIAAAAGADRIATHVLAEIDRLGGGKVIGIERARAKTALERQRVKEFGALFAVAAVAAAFWLMPSRGPDPVAVAPKVVPAAHVAAPAPSALAAVTPGPATPATPATPDPAASVVASATDPESSESPAVDIQSVESPSHPVSIFYMPAIEGLNAQSSSVVVWIGE